MYRYVYVEINILCILILMYILLNLRNNIDKQLANVQFYKVIASVLIILALDVSWILIEGSSVPAMRIYNNLINAWYLFQTGVISYFWFYFIEGKFKNAKSFRGLRLKLMALPLAALCVISFTSPWTGWLFYVDKFNVYHRGRFHSIQIIIAYFYLIASAYNVLRRLVKLRF